MLTAAYMPVHLLRPEFAEENNLAFGDVQVQPIDAPETMPAGSFYWCNFTTIEGGYPSPSRFRRCEK